VTDAADERKARALDIVSSMQVLSARMQELIGTRNAIDTRHTPAGMITGRPDEVRQALQEIDDEYDSIAATHAQLTKELLREVAEMTAGEPVDS
jgi:ATP-dependent protease ClpP protease subunit